MGFGHGFLVYYSNEVCVVFRDHRTTSVSVIRLVEVRLHVLGGLEYLILLICILWSHQSFDCLLTLVDIDKYSHSAKEKVLRLGTNLVSVGVNIPADCIYIITIELAHGLNIPSVKTPSSDPATLPMMLNVAFMLEMNSSVNVK